MKSYLLNIQAKITMRKLWGGIEKELLLLKRDILGFAVIFLMPVVLIITITYIQNAVEKASLVTKFPVVVVSKDKGKQAKQIIENLKKSTVLEIATLQNGKSISLEQGKKVIQSGKQKVMIVLPPDFSKQIQHQIDTSIERMMQRIMQNSIVPPNNNFQPKKPQQIALYFDPTLGISARNSVKTVINEMVSKMETEAIYNSFEKKLKIDMHEFATQKLVKFKEYNVSGLGKEMKPNAVQHNLPAWSLFAIFFIILPLSINIVKEKNQGTSIRLLTLPVRSITLLLSKIFVYLLVCMVQFYLMLFISIYLFPIIGLPSLNIEGKFFYLSIVAFFSSLAAIGFGVLIGTFAKTHEQAAPFGATAVVILAAIGGLWFPVYSMPPSLQAFASISPMNWGLEGFYNVLLRNTDFFSLLPYLLLLFLFFLANIFIVVISEARQRR